MQHTAASLAALITADVEPDHADRVLAALRPFDGQPITVRILDKLPGGRVEWRISRELGQTQLRNRAFKHGDKENGIELTVARTDRPDEPMNIKWIERENADYFEGRRTRNEQRAALVANTALLERVAFVMNEVEELHRKLAIAKQQFAVFYTECDAPCYVARYTLQRACGLLEAK